MITKVLYSEDGGNRSFRNVTLCHDTRRHITGDTNVPCYEGSWTEVEGREHLAYHLTLISPNSEITSLLYHLILISPQSNIT